MTNEVANLRPSALSRITHSTVRGVLWGPRKIVKAVRMVKAAASNLIERVRSAMQRRPSRAVKVQPSLAQLAGPSSKLATSSDPLELLWMLKKDIETSPDLRKTNHAFLEKHGHLLSHGDVNRLTNAIQHPAAYPGIVDKIIAGLEQEKRL